MNSFSPSNFPIRVNLNDDALTYYDPERLFNILKIEIQSLDGILKVLDHNYPRADNDNNSQIIKQNLEAKNYFQRRHSLLLNMCKLLEFSDAL
jgi:hypothetical protein